MYDDSYLVPANAKRGTLIFNIFRKFDLILFASGVLITMGLLVFVSGDSFVSVILAVIPAGIAGLLVLPIPNYHNVLCAIQSVIAFYTNNREYEWKGWCFYEQFVNNEKSKK